MEYFDIADFNEGYSKADFYCGITGDIEANLRRHNVKGYAACVLCNSFETASEVEKRLGELGFYIGTPKNKGGNEYSRIVYMVERTREFKQ